MLNRAILQGRLVANPELRHTQSGVAVTQFRIACNRDYRSKDPDAQNCDFITIIAWRQTAEFISRYFDKGSMILVDGRIQTRNYTDKGGNKRSTTEIIADSANFCESRRESAERTARYEASSDYAPSNMGQAPANEFAELNDDGELPF